MKAASSVCLFYHVGSIKASPSLNLKVAVAVFSGRSRPSDKGRGGGGGGGKAGYPDPEIYIRGVQSQKNFFFSPSGLSRGGSTGIPSLSLV